MTTRTPDTLQPPDVSVVMANWNGARFIADALLSARKQTLRTIEILVVDDASTDGSPDIAEAIAAGDARIRVIRLPHNQGPAAARNAALDAARGRWIAVQDSDDLMHPCRLAQMVQAAERDGAGIVADNMLVFDDGGAEAPAPLLPLGRAGRVSLPDYLRSNRVNGRQPGLGYLKPLFRAELIARTGARYDVAMRNGEDAEFVARLMAAGASFLIVPGLTYFYRKHAHSISHRLTPDKIAAMQAAEARFRSRHGGGPGVAAALDVQRRSFADAFAFEHLVTAIKARRAGDAVRAVLARPSAVLLLRQPVAARLRRRRRPLPAPQAGRRQVCFITRQRIVDASSGSTAYLLSLAAYLRAKGCDVHLVGVSPSLFGRWPWLKLHPGMDVFASIGIRSGLRLGRTVFATDPAVLFRSAVGIAGQLLGRVGLDIAALNRPAPYSIGAAWTDRDRLFVASRSRGRADAILADYCFQVEGIPYALRPHVPSAIVMHDLFSARAAQFDRLGTADSVARLDAAAEAALLAQADAVVAIQDTEGRAVQAMLPGRRVIVAPMAADSVPWPQPGQGHGVLFVGSSAAPNVNGLRWFLDKCWPGIRQAVPTATLDVAGNAGPALGQSAPGVRLLGRVADLAPLYAAAAVVVSPLRAGSGLKIKLIEALGHGKAIVATPVTLQGVEDLADAVLVRDTPADFTAAVTALLTTPAQRTALGEAALAAARARFGPASCYDETAAFLLQAREGQPA